MEELIPTGAVPSVSIANISVYYVFKCLVYNQESGLLEFLRFVDDGCGFFNGSVAEFNCWFESLRVKSVDRFGLDLTCVVNKVSIFTQFLDIQFKIVNGILTTDIFRKETDANRYLYYNSFHPKHVFRSIVYSQALRYRRIINDDSVLRERLDQLSVFLSNLGILINWLILFLMLFQLNHAPWHTNLPRPKKILSSLGFQRMAQGLMNLNCVPRKLTNCSSYQIHGRIRM